MFKKILAIVMVLAMVLAFAGCGAKEDDKLVMATNAAFPPYEFKADDGSFAGIDVEIAGLIAKELGRELEIVDIDFGAIIAGVQTGKYDIGMAGMTVTEERKQSIDFTDSYATGIQSVIVPEGSSIAAIEDLADKTIGVQQDTTGHIYASDEYGDEAVIPFNKGTDAVAALVSGKVDCVIIDNQPAKSFVAANDGLKILDTDYATEEYAICISKENPELLEKVNSALAELIADGTVQTIIDKYISAE